jgi:ABC-type spermidine/putrescine transport system permease subunit I
VLAAGIAALAWDSVHTYNAFLGTQGKLSLTQYSQVISDPLFRSDLVRTLEMSCLTAGIAVAIAVPFSLFMARSPHRGLRLALIVVIFVPYLTGDITRTFGWLAVLGPHGPLVWLANRVGVNFPELIATVWAESLGMVQILLPAAVVILLPAVLRLNPELERAAATLGARPTRTFFHVTLPQLRFGCVAALTACWALAAGDFADPAVLGQGVKDFLANYLQSRYLDIGDVPEGAATGLILIALVTVGAALILLLGRVRVRRSVL